MAGRSVRLRFVSCTMWRRTATPPARTRIRPQGIRTAGSGVAGGRGVGWELLGQAGLDAAPGYAFHGGVTWNVAVRTHKQPVDEGICRKGVFIGDNQKVRLVYTDYVIVPDRNIKTNDTACLQGGCFAAFGAGLQASDGV